MARTGGSGGDMPDAVSGASGHPPPDALDRYADGYVDGEVDADMVAHVGNCPQCLAEVEQTRRASAALALSSAAPADLFARIQARRAAGERVILPTPAPEGETLRTPGSAAAEDHPELVDIHRYADGAIDQRADRSLIAHIATCAACCAEVEHARRGAALLSLASRPPDDLFERIRNRRTAGDSVVLPVEQPERQGGLEPAPGEGPARDNSVTSIARQPKRAHTGWSASRIRGWSYAIAATLVLTLGIRTALVDTGAASGTGATRPVASGKGAADSGPGAVATSPPANIVASQPVPRGTTGIASGGIRVPDSTTVALLPSKSGSTTLTSEEAVARWRSTIRSLEDIRIATSVMIPLRVVTDTLFVGLSDAAYDGMELSRGGAAFVRQVAVLLFDRPTYVLVARATGSDGTRVPSSARRASVLRDSLVAAGVEAGRVRVAETPAETPPGGNAAAVVELMVLHSTQR